MPLNKNQLTNILFKQNIELVEYLLKAVSEDHNIDYAILEKDYIKPFRATKKRNTNKKGRMTCYSMFLKDKKVEEELKERFPDKTFGEISKEKALVWKAMSKKDKDHYREMAKEFNLNLTKKLETIPEITTVIN